MFDKRHEYNEDAISVKRPRLDARRPLKMDQYNSDVMVIFNILRIRPKEDDGIETDIPAETLHTSTATRPSTRSRCTLHLSESQRLLSVSNTIAEIKTYSRREDGQSSSAHIILPKPFSIPFQNILVPDHRRCLAAGGRYVIQFELELLGMSPWPPVHIAPFKSPSDVLVDAQSRSHWRISSTTAPGSIHAGVYTVPLVLHLPQPLVETIHVPTEYHLEYEIRFSAESSSPSRLIYRPSPQPIKREIRDLLTPSASSTASSHSNIEVSWGFEHELVGFHKITKLGCLLCVRNDAKRTTAEMLKQHLRENHGDSLVFISNTSTGGLYIRCRPLNGSFGYIQSPCHPAPSLSPEVVLLPANSTKHALSRAPIQAGLGSPSPVATAPDTGKLLFYSQSFAVIRPGDEILPVPVDTSWILKKNIDRAKNLPHLEQVEKEYVTRWVMTWGGNPEDSNAYLPDVWLDFVNRNSQWLVASRERMQQFSKDAIIFVASGSIQEETLEKGNEILRAAAALAKRSPHDAEGNTILPRKKSDESGAVRDSTRGGCAICKHPVTRANAVRCAIKTCRVRVHRDCILRNWKISDNLPYRSLHCQECINTAMTND